MKLHIILIGLIMTVGTVQSFAQSCQLVEQKEQFVLSNPTKTSCDFNLKKNLDKPVLLVGQQASNINLNCQNFSVGNLQKYPSILIQTELKQKLWSVPENIKIQNCHVRNGIRIHGAGRNGQAAQVKASSQQLGHTQRMQQRAPSHIVLDRIRFTAVEHNLLYLAPGVHHISLRNSQFSGETQALAIYMDAESANNIIENNQFKLKNRKRELIAIDGSAFNIIRNNNIDVYKNGAIFLYRNCGEGGTVRHQTPSYNQILRNQFHLKNSSNKPVIWVGSRAGKKSYCGADRGFAFGSSINDQDLAQHNVINNNTLRLSGFRLASDRFVVWTDHSNRVQNNQVIKR